MSSKSEQAYDFLRKSIIDGTIPPNMPLRIQSLGLETGFGSTPVREALCRLEAERFVVSEMNRGFRSAPISMQDMADLENSRLVIESALLTESIRTGDDQWEAAIVAAHYRLAKLDLPIEAVDEAAKNHWSAVHQGFHDALLAAAKSKWLRSFHTQISEQLDRFYHFTMDGPLRKKFEHDPAMKALLRQVLGIEHHTKLMQATLNRDEALAISLHAEHIRFAKEYFTLIFKGK